MDTLAATLQERTIHIGERLRSERQVLEDAATAVEGNLSVASREVRVTPRCKNLRNSVMLSNRAMLSNRSIPFLFPFPNFSTDGAAWEARGIRMRDVLPRHGMDAVGCAALRRDLPHHSDHSEESELDLTDILVVAYTRVQWNDHGSSN